VPFYMPSWSSDINVTQIIGSGDVAFVADDTGYSSFSGFTEARTNVYILLKNGTYFTRRIQSGSVNTSTNKVTYTFDSPLGVDVHPEDIKIMCWLHKVRLAADAVSFAWKTNYVSEATLIVQLVDA